MKLEELEKLREYNELDLLFKLIDIAENCKKDTEKILHNKKQPGIRVRNKMQDIRLLAEIIRDRIQIRKGLEPGPKRKNKLEIAIKEELIRLKKDLEHIQETSPDANIQTELNEVNHKLNEL